MYRIREFSHYIIIGGICSLDLVLQVIFNNLFSFIYHITTKTRDDLNEQMWARKESESFDIKYLAFILVDLVPYN